MLKKINKIIGSGFFENYNWSDVPEFARINVIYGPNGTGKTSFADIFDGLRNSDDNSDVNAQRYENISVSIDDGMPRVVNRKDDPFFGRIHVFTERFVERNHNFTAGEAHMPAILTVGKKSIDDQKELESLREELASKTIDQGEKETAKNQANSAREAMYKSISEQVVSVAAAAGGRWSSRNSFSARHVETAFQGSHDDWRELTEEKLNANIGIVNSSNSLSITNHKFELSVADDLKRRLEVALAAKPISSVLDSLRDHPSATKWVDEGRQLHGGVRDCIFCGSLLTTDRRNLIDKHFSDTVKALQDDLTSLHGKLRAILLEVDSVTSNIPAIGLFFDDLRPRYEAAATEIRGELKDLKLWVEYMIQRVETKRSNVLSDVNITVVNPPSVLASLMLGLINEHNLRYDQRDELVRTAAKEIELHYLKSAELGVRESMDKVHAIDAELEPIRARIFVINARIAVLETVEGNPMPTAEVLTTEVARLLGRNELKFESANGLYEVTRNGEKAGGLSTGERNAITLVHFLQQVANFHLSKGKKPIVIIDDPVSSLDSDFFMGVSTYIWNEAIVKDHIDQLFLLTHNFELFRQWDIQIQQLKRAKTTDGLDYLSVYPTKFYEIRSKYLTQSGQTKRCPHIVEWPPSDAARKMIRSTYHHGFMALANARIELIRDNSLENRQNAQLLFPNVIRRVLENFLAFKQPDWVGDFTSAMRNSADILRATGYQGDADALRLRLTRYAHAYSHSENPATDSIVSPDEVSSAIVAAFEFMKCLDGVHFDGLCKVTGIKISELSLP